jgi:DNA-binding response OmpR family regulator
VRVLVVEDEAALADAVARGLRRDGMAVDVAYDGVDGHEKATVTRYDVIVLDRDLPGMSGDELCRQLAAEGALTRVLMLTASGTVADRVEGLSLGADDYMAKPFALAELSARLRALLRRGTPRETRLTLADLEMDTVRRTVTRAGRKIDLKPKEYALLEFLMRHSDRPVTKSLIIEHVWDIHFDSVSNVVEVHVNSLRNKVDRGFDVPLIHTVRGVGYMLTDAPP